MLLVPTYLDISFVLITLTTVFLFWRVISRSTDTVARQRWGRYLLIGSVFWLLLQGTIAYLGIYDNSLDALPPRIALLGLIPALSFIIIVFFVPQGKRLIDSLPLREMTILHVIRIPVELVLYGLFVAKAIPELMTFAGRNFDILAGLTAPLVVYWAWRPSFRRQLLIVWNVLCLALLLNIVIHALLAAPFPLQQLAFDQPNIAVLYFPFVWLPVYVVPVVLFCHLAALRQLWRKS